MPADPQAPREGTGTTAKQFDVPPLFVLIQKLVLFRFWSSCDRVAYSFGVSPSRLECGLS